MWQVGDDVICSTALDLKGEEIQKLSVIQSLPNLLATDVQACMSQVVPKMQQSLPTASPEFHLAAASTFKTIIEQKLISHAVFSQTFLQSILSSLDSHKNDSVIYRAWLEALLDVIELLPAEDIRSQILDFAVNYGQLAQPILLRIASGKLLGKMCTRFDSEMIQKEVLPTVQSLCQDVYGEVRANMCLQLPYVAEGLKPECVKPALLPSLVELAIDEDSDVRIASIQTIVNLIPLLEQDTLINIIVPLIKKLCDNASVTDDDVICVIAQEFGKLISSLQDCLTVDRKWFLNYFQELSKMGLSATAKKYVKPELTFIVYSDIVSQRCLQCRRQCAFNLPAIFNFVISTLSPTSSSSEEIDLILSIFSALSYDPYYMVRRTVACGFHEVAKILGPRLGSIEMVFERLLKDESVEVLEGLIPNLTLILEWLHSCEMTNKEEVRVGIGKALLKCEAEIASTNSWRLAAILFAQFESLPKHFPSDFLYSYFVPLSFTRILKARPLPIRLAAGRMYLVLLRYNAKSVQRTELRNRLLNELAKSSDYYVRMLFVRMMVEAMSIFSTEYFKKYFFMPLMNLAEDPIANIRLKVVMLMPLLKGQLRVPTDKKLLTALETTLRHLATEKDKDVNAALLNVTKALEEIEVLYEGQSKPATSSKINEDLKKLEEEKRISLSGKVTSDQTGKKSHSRSRSAITNRSKSNVETSTKLIQPIKDSTSTSRERSDSAKSSTSNNTLTSNWVHLTPNRNLLTYPSEKINHSASTTSTASLDNDYWKTNILATTEKSFSKLSLFEALVTSLPKERNQGSEHRCCNFKYCPCNKYDFEFSQSKPHALCMHNRHICSDLNKPFLLATNSRGERSQDMQHYNTSSLLTRNIYRTNFAIRNKLPNVPALRTLTNTAQYNFPWTFSSLPEIPVALSDDEFLVDAGIRMPAQLLSSQNISKIPNWQNCFDKKKVGSIDVHRNNAIFDQTSKVVRYSSEKYDHTEYRSPQERSEFKTDTSLDYKERYSRLSALKENFDDQQFLKSDLRSKRYSTPNGRVSFRLDSSEEKPIDDNLKRNSGVNFGKDRKLINSKSLLDRGKRHSASYTIKIPDSKDTKQKLKRHSMDVTTDCSSIERFNRPLRRYSTLDVNHNQGLGSSKIPLRSSSISSGSRTAPTTRASSPIRSHFRFSLESCPITDGLCTENRFDRLSSSNEEVYKFCQRFIGYESTFNKNPSSLRSRDSKLPVRSTRKRL
ncbi:serine/threonine-protein phosphatase 4 regulatory subunit 4-like isoform X2 [Prorops nasuta]|uniref:serine/threonine-protein phosphatase 4 regulatory subunit 4-like isoform X2 n=1 Tax=Prorops nasuta TaxID=863751 RepID=UPI0034CEF34E